jgi:hypothetical protein
MRKKMVDNFSFEAIISIEFVAEIYYGQDNDMRNKKRGKQA